MFRFFITQPDDSGLSFFCKASARAAATVAIYCGLRALGCADGRVVPYVLGLINTALIGFEIETRHASDVEHLPVEERHLLKVEIPPGMGHAMVLANGYVPAG